MCRRSTVAAAMLWLLPATGTTVAGELSYSGSLQYATGHYTLEERTTSLYLFNGVRWGVGRWAVQANVPFVLLSPSQAAEPMTTMSGVGDAFLRVDRELAGLRGNRPAVRVVAEIKAPLSRMHANLGTGEWDFGAGVSLAERLGASFVLADATYWKFGDPPGIDLRDALAYGVGVGRPFGRLGVLATVTGYSGLVSGVAPPVQAGLFFSWWTSRLRSISAGTVFGLTSAAPDVGLSLGWRVGL